MASDTEGATVRANAASSSHFLTSCSLGIPPKSSQSSTWSHGLLAGLGCPLVACDGGGRPSQAGMWSAFQWPHPLT